jgi:DNA-binding NarL/FixJ family response regulator
MQYPRKTRRGGLRPISSSCRSYCASRSQIGCARKFQKGRGDDASFVGRLRSRNGGGSPLRKPTGDAEIREAGAELSAINAKIATLTPREREVLSHVIAGRLNKQIAADLGTVEKTIKVHRGRVMEKLGVRTVADLVRLAAKAGI